MIRFDFIHGRLVILVIFEPNSIEFFSQLTLPNFMFGWSYKDSHKFACDNIKKINLI